MMDASDRKKDLKIGKNKGVFQVTNCGDENYDWVEMVCSSEF
jgi:hypothetical protein